MLAIDEPLYFDTWHEYNKQKQMSHDGSANQHTFAGVLPWLYWNMLYQHNLRSRNTIEMRLERSYVTVPEYMPEAQNQTQREIMLNRTQYWGRAVDQITLKPAIYCMLSERHAQFGQTIPDYPGARVIMAFQFIKVHSEEKEIKK